MITVCLFFSFSRSVLNVSCIFSILFLRFWIIFTIITLNSFSGRLPISYSFVLSCGLLPHSFICCIFLCLLILFKLLCLRSSFCRLQGHSPSYFCCLSPVGENGPVACVGFLVGELVPVFWCVELDLFPLMGRAASGGVFCSVSELSMTLGSLSANGWCFFPVLLVVWHEASSPGACWPLG